MANDLVNLGLIWSKSVYLVRLVYFGPFQCTYLKIGKDRFGLRLLILSSNLLKNIDGKKYLYYF